MTAGRFPFTWERLLTTPGGVCHACTSRPRPNFVVPRGDGAWSLEPMFCAAATARRSRVPRITRELLAPKLAGALPVFERAARRASESIPLLRMPIADAADMTELILQLLIAGRADELRRFERWRRSRESFTRANAADHSCRLHRNLQDMDSDTGGSVRYRTERRRPSRRRRPARSG